MNIESLLTDEGYTKIRNILVSLAQKSNPERTTWCSTWGNAVNNKVKCFICNRIVCKVDENNIFIIRKHGVQHLIDSNLLPFI